MVQEIQNKLINRTGVQQHYPTVEGLGFIFGYKYHSAVSTDRFSMRAMATPVAPLLPTKVVDEAFNDQTKRYRRTVSGRRGK